MSDKARKYPDEEDIEKILNKIKQLAWYETNLDITQKQQLFDDLKWILDIWSKKYLGHNKLSKIITNEYLEKFEEEKVLKELDLVICFFQHYIYAFEEFMTREFRDSVIRCGLASERLVNRLAMADNHPEILTMKNFEDKANKMMSLLEKRTTDAIFLINRMKYVYSKRSTKAAHDTGVAGILVAKGCISEMPIAYMEYLNTLRKIGYKITPFNDLITLVNETVSIGTTLLVSKPGAPIKIEDVITSMYSQHFFNQGKSFKEIQTSLGQMGYNPPKTSLWRSLDTLCKEKKIQKIDRGTYIQRTPPEKYFNKEIAD